MVSAQRPRRRACDRAGRENICPGGTDLCRSALGPLRRSSCHTLQANLRVRASQQPIERPLGDAAAVPILRGSGSVIRGSGARSAPGLDCAFPGFFGVFRPPGGDAASRIRVTLYAMAPGQTPDYQPVR